MYSHHKDELSEASEKIPQRSKNIIKGTKRALGKIGWSRSLRWLDDASRIWWLCPWAKTSYFLKNVDLSVLTCSDGPIFRWKLASQANAQGQSNIEKPTLAHFNHLITRSWIDTAAASIWKPLKNLTQSPAFLFFFQKISNVKATS